MRRVIHYGRGGKWRSSCGATTDPTRMSTDRQQVTCWSCRGTRQWREHFYAETERFIGRSWDVLTYHPGRDALPPDLTLVDQPDKECRSEWHNFLCTRRKGHTGRHAAGDSEVIVAVWPQEGER